MRGRRPRLQSGNCNFPKSSPTFNCTRLVCYVSAMAKSINIKNEEAASLVAELTAGTGKGTTELILELLRHEAESRRRFSNNVLDELDELITEFGIRIAPVDASQARIAAQGFAKYGKGGHAARLNFGDLFAYALAKTRDEPLLFKGDDFAKT